MRLRNIPGARDEIAACRYVIQNEEMSSIAGRWRERFGQDRPVHIEIGMGKGRFLTQMARVHPDISYVGLEMYSSVLVRALQGRRELDGSGLFLDNLLYLRMDAKDLENVFAPAEVSRIYLNFSDPWPKERHEKRRLPGRCFLRRYEKILSPDGTVEFKTDNRALFTYALIEAQEAGWSVEACSFDLHRDPLLSAGNIMTEYEEKFSSAGHPICKYIIRPVR